MKRVASLVLSIVLVIGLMLPLSSCSADGNGDTTVYVTDTGECYHRSGCDYLSKSKNSISLEKAVRQGYRACSVCKPPELID